MDAGFLTTAEKKTGALHDEGIIGLIAVRESIKLLGRMGKYAMEVLSGLFALCAGSAGNACSGSATAARK